MPIATIQAPDGKMLEVQVPDGATNEQIISFVSSNYKSEPSPQVGASTFIEPALSMISGAAAEPIAGIAGIAQGLNPFADKGAATNAINATREALTYKPMTEGGRAGLQAVGQALAPVGEVISGAEKTLGDATFNLTNSPTLAAAAATLPTALIEALGMKGGGRIARGTKATKPSEGAIRSTLVEAAPAPSRLKQISSGLYDELENSGIAIKPNSYKQLLNNINTSTKRVSARTTPTGAGLIQDLKDVVGTKPTLNELRDLRDVAKDIAKDPVKREARVGSIVADEIEKFISNLDDKKVIRGNIPASEVGKKLKAADQLWGRASKGELIQEAIKKAEKRASGFENGLRVEFDKITNNKRLSHYFSPSELEAMNALVKGDTKQNLAKLIGRFGFSEGRATNTLASLMGGGAGAAVGGLQGAFAIPVLGQVGRVIAQKLTKNQAEFINALTRAGKDGKEITKAYLNVIPRSKRSIAELSELLSDPTVDLSGLINQSNKLVKDAMEIAAGRQAIGEAIGVAAASAVQPPKPQEQVKPPKANDLASRIAEAMAARQQQ